MIRSIVAIAKERGQWALGDVCTYSNKSPGHWTALMCVVDMAPSRKFAGKEYDEWRYSMQEVVKELLTVMTLDGMAARATSGSTCWHSIASRAHLFLIPILERAFWASDIKEVLSYKNAKECILALCELSECQCFLSWYFILLANCAAVICRFSLYDDGGVNDTSFR